MATSSNPVRADAQAARDAVSNGQRNNADAQARFAALGGASGASYELRRNGVSVGICPVELSVTGRDISVSQSGAWTSVAAADTDAGTWKARVFNSADASRYVEFDVPAEQTISADLIDNGVGLLVSFVIRCPAYDTGGVTAFPVASDPRTVAYVDPTKAWADQPIGVSGWFGGRDIIPFINSSWNAGATVNPPYSGNRLTMIPESGVVSGGITVFNRVVDPEDSGKRAILHRLHPSAETISGTARSSYNLPSALPYSAVFWTAFACRWANWPGRYTTFFDVHDDAWSVGIEGRVSPHSQSPIQLQMGTNGCYIVKLAGCYIYNYTRDQTVITTSSEFAAVSANSSTASDWHYFIIRWRCARSLNDSPGVTMWRAIGSGTLSEAYSNASVPIGYRDTPAAALFPKLGLYNWDLPTIDHTMHTKGLYVFRDEVGTPTIDQTALLALLRSV